MLSKVGMSAPDISTPSSTTKQAIRLLYGQAVAKDLLSTDISAPRKGKRKRDADDGGPEGSKSDEDGNWIAQAHFTDANYHTKKFVFLLFINSENCDRILLWRPNTICRSPRRVLTDQEGTGGLLHRHSSQRLFAIHLPQVIPSSLLFDNKSTHFHSIQLDPTTVDVNVHPTKREVHFLEEEAITECIADAIQTKLAQHCERTFEYQVGISHVLVHSTNQSSSLRHCLRGGSPQRTAVNRSKGRRRRKSVKTTQVVTLPLLLRHPAPPLQRKFCRNTGFEHLVRIERLIRCFFPRPPSPERVTMRALVTAQMP
jgi:DNA mismatch repair protein MLH1